MRATLALDTNVVLDALYFRDPSVTMLEAAWAAGDVTCLGDAYALAELERVLGYANLNIASEQAAAILAVYRQRIRIVPGSGNPYALPQCRDPKDQPFLELAARGRADALVSKDKKLLELARPHRRPGRALPFDILHPAALHLAFKT
ncbi:MAG: putative toxin-antitoxin system toxin component, PIN family [Zoogloeaceae bacterium]|jgi:putative PIN family toxin of toxin-antitoxin system|nr:putative toxin-antitoxin system toxin component, PIN family [Zoogloeaceae bacterium]